MYFIKRGFFFLVSVFIFIFADVCICSAKDPVYSVRVAESYLALRTAKAFERENEIGELYTGDLVEVQDSSDPQYWYVYAPKLEKSGYVNCNYLVPAEAEPAPEAAPENMVSEKKAPSKEDLKYYQDILDHVDSYVTDEGHEYNHPTGVLQYALVSLNKDCCPALLILKEYSNGIADIHVFQYDAEKKVMCRPKDMLYTGVGLVGGYRGFLTASKDKNGLIYLQTSSGTGATTISRVTMSENELLQAIEWEGILGQQPDMNDEEIDWFDLSSSAENTVSVQDGNRIILQGTIKNLSYDEVLALQGIADPNQGGSQLDPSMTIFVLDTPQDLTLATSDPSSKSACHTATMIRIKDFAEINNYNGQHVTASFDANNTWWPSDTRVPVGQPGTSDIHILY